MPFYREVDLQDAYLEVLARHGYPGQAEVHVSERQDRIDILTHRHIIECKLRLDRDSAYQALGQLSYYSQFYPHHQKVIVVAGIEDANAAQRVRDSGVTLINMPEPQQPLLSTHSSQRRNEPFRMTPVRYSRRRYPQRSQTRTNGTPTPLRLGQRIGQHFFS